MKDKEASDGFVGCLGIIGLVLLGVAVWLIWQAVQWVVSDWHWAWGLGAIAVVPVLSFAVVVAWRVPQPVVPTQSWEPWLTAVAVSITLTLPALVLLNGWGTAIFALVLAAPCPIALAFAPEGLSLPRVWPPRLATAPAAAVTIAKNSNHEPAEDPR